MTPWSVLLVLVVVVAMVAPSTAQDYDDWMKAVPHLGQSITFNCTNEGVHPREPDPAAGFTIISWMLPSLERINPGNNQSNINVSEDGFNMNIVGVQKHQLGVYHCMRRNDSSGEWNLVKWGLNMRGPYFEDLWHKYQWNVIIGTAAGGGFAVLTTLVLLIYAFRWQPPPGDNLADRYELVTNYGAANASAAYDYREDAFDKRRDETGQACEAYRQQEAVSGVVRSGVVRTTEAAQQATPEPPPDYPQAYHYNNHAATGDDGRADSTPL